MTTTLRTAVCIIAASVNSSVYASGEGGRADSTPEIVARFSQAWSDTVWKPKTARGRGEYMRPLDDGAWKTRMVALQEVSKLGDGAADALRKLLRGGTAAERQLAAQVAGFGGCQSLREDLIRAAESDSDAAVRLYAVDSLGRLGKPAQDELYRRLLSTEKNRDVKMHLNYALERKDEPLRDGVRQSLLKWDAKQIDSAKLGEQAPDFELPALSGETIRLSSFRGKQAVVLVFVYGDT